MGDCDVSLRKFHYLANIVAAHRAKSRMSAQLAFFHKGYASLWGRTDALDCND